MFSNFRTPAIVFSFIALFLAPPLTHAATPQSDNAEQVMAVYSKFKTFGDFAKWLQAYDLATTEELHGVQKNLQKNGLSFKTEVTKGVFTSKRMNWDDIYLAKIVAGDWKTTGGRILVAHKETTVDGLFAQALTTFDPKSAQHTPFDLLIEPADALSTANARASAAAGWTWLVILTGRANAKMNEVLGTSGKGKVDCTRDGKFIVIAGWDDSKKSFLPSEKMPDQPVDSKLIDAINVRSPGLIRNNKCTPSNAALVDDVYHSPGRTPGEKVKYSKDFSFGMADALGMPGAKADHAAHSAR